MINRLKQLYFNNKEIILYIIFGGLTTVISYAVFYCFYSVLGVNELISNVFSWVSGVLFSFFTNRKYVFNKTGKSTFKELLKFSSGRITTLLFDELMIFVFVTLLKFNAFVIKIISSVFVVILNYLISKFIVFK